MCVIRIRERTPHLYVVEGGERVRGRGRIQMQRDGTLRERILRAEAHGKGERKKKRKAAHDPRFHRRKELHNLAG